LFGSQITEEKKHMFTFSTHTSIEIAIASNCVDKALNENGHAPTLSGRSATRKSIMKSSQRPHGGAEKLINSTAIDDRWRRRSRG